MKEFFKMFGAALAALFVWGIISGLASMMFFIVFLSSLDTQSNNDDVTIKKNSVLELDLSKTVAERSDKSYLLQYSSSLKLNDMEIIGLNDIEEALSKAKDDNKIQALYVNLSECHFPDIASAEAIRKMILDFRECGKPTFAFADSYRALNYYVATACEKIYMRKLGDFVFAGLSSESMYYKGALDKFGIEAQIIRHGKFKSAVEPFMQEKMSDANRLQTQTYLNDIWKTILTGISQSRNVSESQLNKYADNLSLYSNDDLCISSGLIDSVLFEDEFMTKLFESVDLTYTNESETVSISKYCKSLENDYAGNPNIAVIYATGEIVSDDNGEECITSKSMLKSIREVMDDDDIKAVVLRVNSPGGSAVEAEIIYNELKKLQAQKPLVVSMSGYAASGGYYIACPADKILAEETTITGSIGVFGLLLSPEKLVKNTLGINIEIVSTNKHADFETGITIKDSEEMRALQNSVENVYDIFISHVAEGRKMTKAEVDSVGQGRVWTGISALNIGLVDQIGGLQDAINEAANLADLSSYKIKTLPEKEDGISKFMNTLFEVSATKIYGNEFYEYKKAADKLKNRKGVQCYMQPAKIY